MKKITLSLFLYLFTVAGYCQLPISSLFDLKKSVTAISKTTLKKADAFKASAFHTEKLPNGNLKVCYHYKKTADDDRFFTYEVSLTNFKFINKGKIPINGKIHETYTHTHDFVQKTYLVRETPFSEYQDTVEETYLVGYGLVNQKRQGTMTFFNEGVVQVIKQVLISELLNIR